MEENLGDSIESLDEILGERRAQNSKTRIFASERGLATSPVLLDYPSSFVLALKADSFDRSCVSCGAHLEYVDSIEDSLMPRGYFECSGEDCGLKYNLPLNRQEKSKINIYSTP